MRVMDKFTKDQSLNHQLYAIFLNLEQAVYDGYILKSRLSNKMPNLKRKSLNLQLDENLIMQYLLVEKIILSIRDKKKNLLKIEKKILELTQDTLIESEQDIREYVYKKHATNIIEKNLVNFLTLHSLINQHDTLDLFLNYYREYSELIEKFDYYNHPLIHQEPDFKQKYYSALTLLVKKMFPDYKNAFENLHIFKNKFRIKTEEQNTEFTIETEKKLEIICQSKYELTSNNIKMENWSYLLLADALLLCKDICEFTVFKDVIHELGPKMKLGTKDFREVCSFINTVKVEAYISSEEFLKITKYKQLAFFDNQFKKHAYKVFTPNKIALVVGTMSSGKSTFLNSIMGKELFPSKNEACTAKVYQYFCKTNLAQYLVKKNNAKKHEVYEELNHEHLEKWNDTESLQNLMIEGPISQAFNLKKKLTFIDTPGPNNSMDKKHNSVMEQALKLPFNKVLYLINATQLGTDDDRFLLQKIQDHLKKNPQQDIIFVVNKVDEFDNNEVESLTKLKESVVSYLNQNGFKSPKIIFISALAAKLAQKALMNDQLSRREKNQLSFFEELFLEHEYNLEALSTVQVNNGVNSCTFNISEKFDTQQSLKNIIQYSGLLHLLRCI